MYFKIISLGTALLSGIFSSLRVFQAKYVNMHYKYSPLDFSVDAGILIGVTIFVCAVTYFFLGEPSYNWHNFTICSFSSCF